MQRGKNKNMSVKHARPHVQLPSPAPDASGVRFATAVRSGYIAEQSNNLICGVMQCYVRFYRCDWKRVRTLFSKNN
jgi:hypothetical protein